MIEAITGIVLAVMFIIWIYVTVTRPEGPSYVARRIAELEAHLLLVEMECGNPDAEWHELSYSQQAYRRVRANLQREIDRLRRGLSSESS